MASQVLGSVGTDGDGLSGLEYADNRLLAGRDGVQRTVNDARGQQISISNPRPALAGATLELNLDAAIQDKVEAVLQQVGATYRPKDATAIVMDPRSGALLAVANWPRVDANDPGGAPASALEDRATGFDYEPGSTFKAFTVAGALTGRRRHARHVVRPAAADPGRRPHDPRRRGPRPGDADDRADPVAVQQRRRDHDRRARAARARPRPPGLLDPPLRLRHADRRRPARRGARDRAAARQVVGLVDRQHPDRPGHLGHADADRDRLRRDRQRRHPAPAADRAPRRRPARAAAARAPRHLGPRRRRAAPDARGRAARRAAPRRRSRSPATSSPARPAPRTRSTRRPASTPTRPTSPRSSASRRPPTRSCWSR